MNVKVQASIKLTLFNFQLHLDSYFGCGTHNSNHHIFGAKNIPSKFSKQFTMSLEYFEILPYCQNDREYCDLVLAHLK